MKNRIFAAAVSCLVCATTSAQLQVATQKTHNFTVEHEGQQYHKMIIEPAVMVPGGFPAYTVEVTVDTAYEDFYFIEYSIDIQGVDVYTETWHMDFANDTYTVEASTPSQSTGVFGVDRETGIPLNMPANFSVVETQSAWARQQIEHSLNALAEADPASVTVIDLIGGRGVCFNWITECCVLNNGPTDPSTNNFDCQNCCNTFHPHPGPNDDCSGFIDSFRCCLQEANADYCDRLCASNGGSVVGGVIDTAACMPKSIF